MGNCISMGIIEKYVNVFVERLDKDIPLPSYAHFGDAGMDVRSTIDATILPNTTEKIPIGLKFAIPSGYEIQVRPRSGMSLKTKLRISNSPGTIDENYRDEVAIIIDNIGSTGYKINRGDRIAQIVLSEVPKMHLDVVESVANIGQNRGGGFGSSGMA